MTEENYKLQTSLKFGPYQQHMVNVRANSVNEMLELLDGLYNSRGFINSVATELVENNEPDFSHAVDNVKSEFPTTTEHRPGVVDPPRTYGSQPEPYECIHGAMKKYSGVNKNGEPYTAYFCPGPKNQPQCKPKFLD